MDKKTLVDLMSILEYNKLAEGGASHSLPEGVVAKKDGDPNWRDMGNANPSDKNNKDWIMGNGSDREKMLKLVGAKMLVNHLMPANPTGLAKILQDSLMETQKVNLENRMNEVKAPTMLMLNYKW